MAYDVQLSRYYNRFAANPQFSDYKVLLFRAGDALQSAELNEVQETLHNENTHLARNFLTNGSIVSGGKVQIERTSAGTNPSGDEIFDLDFTCEASTMFLNTYYVAVSQSSIQLAGEYLPTQEDNVGVKITYVEITSSDDASLKDPAVETRNYAQPGAARLKITGEWIFESEYIDTVDTEFIPLFKIIQGEIVSLQPMSQFERSVINLIAKYDRNANGNYVIDGYEVSYLSSESNLGPYKLSVAEGNANVYGWNYETQISQDIIIAPLIDFELKQSEPNEFGAVGIVDNFYPVRHTPVRKVYRISGQKEIADETVTHGGFLGASDELINQPVISLMRVWQGATEYVQGVDYQLSGDSISWLGNLEPSPGSTYHAQYRYQYTETDTVGFSGANGTISTDLTSIKVEGFATGTTVSIDYDFTLQRYDAVYIDANGKLNSLKGVPDENDPRVPSLDKEYTLKIAEVLLGGDFAPAVRQASLRVFKMADIQTLLDNIKQNEYNITRLALMANMNENQPTSLFLGQFVDDFTDDSQRDQGYVDLNQNAMTIGGNLILDIDWETHNIGATLPAEQLTIEMPSVVGPVVLSQPYWTKVRQINEYLFKSPPSSTITIWPKTYTWVSKTAYSTFVRSVQTATLGINSFTTRYAVFGTHRWHSVVRSNVSTSTSRQILGSSVSRSSSLSTTRTPEIIPQIPISIASKEGDYNNNEQVNIFFGDVLAGTLPANGAGKLEGSFTIPAGVYSGSKEVRATGIDSQVEGKTLFQATPLTQTITTTVTNWWRWVVQTQGTIWREADPVAQSFVLDQTYAIDGINVYFETSPVTVTSVVICETTAGLPDKTKALISKSLEPQYLTNTTGATYFKFDNKIALTQDKEYAFIVICKDAVGKVKVARLGERDNEAGKWITSQAYSIGVLFNSSNNSAWTPLQEEDMKFEIVSAEFVNDYEFAFNVTTVADATDLMILASAKVDEGTAIQYKVELLDRAENNIFYVNSYSQFPLDTVYNGRVQVTAIFLSEYGLRSPVLDPEVQISVGTSSKVSTYISRAFEFADDATIVDCYLDNYNPANTSITVDYQHQEVQNGALTWVNVPKIGSKSLGYDWLESHFRLEGLTAPYNRQTRVRIILQTTNDKDRPNVSNLRFNVQKI